ncbi:MAG: xanthine phosphoribosyltransferase [Christensenellaceae bacterium]|nr:xanthine phosphoribosyltransferase [Christensenellaceae bacterium]
MEALKQAIEREGVGIGSEIVKVDGFLNHRIDVRLMERIGKAFFEAYRGEQIDCILTVEASGIAAALTTAQAFGGIPVIFAKKGDRRNVGPEAYAAQVYSFTHQRMNTIHVSRPWLPKGSRVLIIDDFLANGEAVEGLISIVHQAECELVGVGICVEKGFQPGGQRLRERGVRVVSLAIVEAIEDGKIILKEDE